LSRLTAHARTEVKAEVKDRTKTAIKAGDRCEGHQGCYSQKSTKVDIDAKLKNSVKSTRLGCK